MLEAKGLEAAKDWHERHVGDGMTKAELYMFTGFLTAYLEAVGGEPPTTTDERAVEALPNWNGWRSIDTAPEDCRVILATAGNWVGEAIMLRDEDTGEQVWTWVDTGKPSQHSLYGWQHLPAPLNAPVASDLRPDGFDGPTGAE